MFSRDDLLQLIRDNVHHPATARELAQLLRDYPSNAQLHLQRWLGARHELLKV